MKRLLVILFSLATITAVSQEFRQVLPSLQNYDSNWKMWVFDEASAYTCTNSPFYFESYYDPNDPKSKIITTFFQYVLYDEAQFLSRSGGTESDAFEANDSHESHHSMEDMFTHYNWSTLTSPKVFYIVVWYQSYSRCANTYTTVAPWMGIMAIKRTFYPKPKVGSIKIVPEQTTSKTIQYNTNPGDFGGIAATGGDGNFSYQWQKKESGGSWVDIYNETSTNYYPQNLTVSTSFRRKDTPDKCGSPFYTNEINITVLPNVTGGTIGTSQTVCYSSSVVLSNVQSPTGGIGAPYTYIWQSSSDGIYFQDIPTAKNEAYTTDNLTSKTYFKRKAISGVNSGESNVIVVSVRSKLTSGTIGSDQTICFGSSPSQITGSLPMGGDENYTYSWESSGNGTSWIPIPNATEINYQPIALNASTHYRRIVTSGSGCGSVNSSPVAITVRDQLTSGVIGSNQTICYATSPAQLVGGTPLGGDGSYTYVWESSLNGNSWEIIPAATSTSYQPGALTTTTHYRRTVSSGSGCGSQTSSSVTINVYGNLTAGNVSANQTICNGLTPGLITCSESTGGNGTYTYSWEQSVNGMSWDIIPGASELNYQPGSLTTTTLFRRTVISGGGCGSSRSSIVTINVRGAIASGAMGSNQTICYNSTPAQIVGGFPSGGDGNYIYKWESSSNGSSWNNITSGGTNVSYQPGTLTATTYYRRTVTSGGGCGSIISSPVKITVNSDLTAGVIGSNQTICHNSTPAQIVGSAATGGDGSYTYKWESSPNGTSWNIIPGAIEVSYSPGALTATTYYRRTVTSGSGCGSRISPTVSISVNGSFSPGNIGAPQTICYGVAPGRLQGEQASGGFGNYTYQWKQSADGQNFIDIPGANDINFQPGILTTTTFYKRSVTCGCGTKESSIITIVVNPELVGGGISSSQTICYNTIPTEISGAIPTGGDGSYTYRWESSANGTTWNNISGGTSSNYQPASLKATTHFRRTVTSGSGCGSKISSPVVIIVNDNLSAGSIYSSQEICHGSSPARISGTEAIGGGGQYTYQWKGKDGTTWNTLPSSNSVNYQPSNLTKTTYYKRFVTSGCGTAATDSIKVEVKGLVNSGSISEAQTICFGSAPDELIGTNASGGFGSYNYQWQNSTDNINYSDIITANEQNYQPGNINNNTYFRRKVTDQNCGSYYSNAILIQTLSKLPAPNVAFRSFYCQGTNVNLNAGNEFTFSWYDANDKLLKTGADYSIKEIQENTTIFVKASNNKNCISDAQQINLTVDQVKANFGIHTGNIPIGEPVQFTNTCENAVKYIWDFSEGEPSSSKNPWHIFNNSGTKLIKLIAISALECSDTITNQIEVGLTALEEPEVNNFKIYPNPVAELLIVEPENLNIPMFITIQNVRGVIIYQKNIEEKQSIDFSIHPAGMYILKLDSKSFHKTIKLVKQ